jgi:4-alpha-glucanotransferase
MTDIQTLARLRGISMQYHDFRGQLRDVAPGSDRAILSAMGFSLQEAAIEPAIRAIESDRWNALAPPAVVVTLGRRASVPLAIPSDLLGKRIAWTVTLEDGQQHSDSIRGSELQVLERAALGAQQLLRLSLPLTLELPLGYHQVAIEIESAGIESARRIEVSLIVAPERCHTLPAIRAGKRLWGIAVQLYSLRSAENWGMGDFGDLRELIELTAKQGGDIVGLNPLHALFPADPAHISPYSPSNRQFLNVLYICVREVAEFAECAAARSAVTSSAFQARLQQLRAAANVDYEGVAAAKFSVLRVLYEQFRSAHLLPGTPRAAMFQRFVEERGEGLRLHAIYDAIHAHLRAQDSQYWGWPSWPEKYQDPRAGSVQRFAHEHEHEVSYFLYLQWLAEEQLRAAQQLARTRGMRVGLYGDVAVGANPGGSETWSNRKLYLQGASVGAPPDELALKGQDWGIPPQDPQELQRQAYRPFIQMLRNAMRPVAALRLDHVMTLFRLWWVPRGAHATHGAYVHYPLTELMAILSLESVRNHCMVIGEDLGTVPEEVRLAMEGSQAYHYKVLLFEKWLDGRFKAPHEYVPTALATVTTHDLPTLRGWWESADILLRDRLDLYPSEQVKHELHRLRAQELRAIMEALTEHGLWHWQPHEPLPQYSPALARAIHVYLGLSCANLAMLQIEDLIGMLDPVNVPGTHHEHANWQRKVSLPTAQILARPEVIDMLDAMNRARRGENPNQ